jgi:hypothetical protein
LFGFGSGITGLGFGSTFGFWGVGVGTITSRFVATAFVDPCFMGICLLISLSRHQDVHDIPALAGVVQSQCFLLSATFSLGVMSYVQHHKRAKIQSAVGFFVVCKPLVEFQWCFFQRNPLPARKGFCPILLQRRRQYVLFLIEA